MVFPYEKKVALPEIWQARMTNDKKNVKKKKKRKNINSNETKNSL